MPNEEANVDAKTAETLLRRFEPVIRFTKGEWFYPMDAEPYVDACSLWVRHPNEDAVCVVPAGDLTLERLAQQPDTVPARSTTLRFPPPRRTRGGVAWRACGQGARTKTQIGPRRLSARAEGDSRVSVTSRGWRTRSSLWCC